ncbi:cytochrome P450 [Aspergillus alliaceus]|uniref:Cytochrome P450 n=1 Tax=Petromyces alliaceus TaxID=209559 RepID=A0A5N7BQK8_PETAA|nr:cytochrome P450 [Aspergillus alliaceus]
MSYWAQLYIYHDSRQHPCHCQYSFLTALGYCFYVGYQHRSKINQVRKQGFLMPKEWNWLTGHLLVLLKYVDPLPPDVNVNNAMRELAMEFAHTDILHGLLASLSLIWKTLRSIFNPEFCTGSMMDLVRAVVDSAQVFCDILREKVGSGLSYLDDLTTRLTMDIILRVTLDMDLDYQRSDNEIDPRILAHPLRPFLQEYYGNVMNRCVRDELDRRFSELKQDQSSPRSTSKRAKSVIALALEAYLADRQTYLSPPGMIQPPTSTSKVYRMLSKHPEVMVQMQEEHNRLFGADPSAAVLRLKKQPSRSDQCSYTLAVIKETLRLFLPAATMRQGRSGVSLTDRHGNVYPTENVGTTILHPAVHLNSRVWPRVPRNCIGQTLVYNENRIVLILNLLTMWDAMQLRNERVSTKCIKWAGFGGEGVKSVNGERAYQTENAPG